MSEVIPGERMEYTLCVESIYSVKELIYYIYSGANIHILAYYKVPVKP